MTLEISIHMREKNSGREQDLFRDLTKPIHWGDCGERGISKNSNYIQEIRGGGAVRQNAHFPNNVANMQFRRLIFNLAAGA